MCIRDRLDTFSGTSPAHPPIVVDTIALQSEGADEFDPLSTVWEGTYTVPVTASGGVYAASITAQSGNLRATDDVMQLRELFGEENINGSILYGALEKASRGILLIDEVSEIPLETQAKILRVLIDQKFKRINGTKDINVNIRIISSTSKDLKSEVTIGNFREDLYHRINVVPIEIPKLSSRPDDIPILINYFQKKISEINLDESNFSMKGGGLSGTSIFNRTIEMVNIFSKFNMPIMATGGISKIEHVNRLKESGAILFAMATSLVLDPYCIPRINRQL